ncbi:hypothetical protein KI387_005119, partial [Taxus chinensis]
MRYLAPSGLPWMPTACGRPEMAGRGRRRCQRRLRYEQEPQAQIRSSGRDSLHGPRPPAA